MHANLDLEVTLNVPNSKLILKRSLKEVLQHKHTTRPWWLDAGWCWGSTFARVLRDALIPSSITFTAWDRGFWAPSSMLVSIPKAACEIEGKVTPSTCGWRLGPWAERSWAPCQPLLTTPLGKP
jgi:hypothetical protein